MRFEEKALVLRSTDVGENGCYLDVLTERRGRMSVFARGVRSYKSKNRMATMPMTYSALTLDRQKDDFVVLVEAQAINIFGDEKRGLARKALAMYVIDTLRQMALPDEAQGDLLRLALNTLYANESEKYPTRHIKAAYELRLMANEGYAPDLDGCCDCGRSDADDAYIDIMNGALICGECRRKRDEAEEAGKPADDATATILAPVSRAAVDAMRYVMRAPLARLFAFKLEPAAETEFAAACEQYILNHLERGFTTLDFYKQVEGL